MNYNRFTNSLHQTLLALVFGALVFGGCTKKTPIIYPDKKKVTENEKSGEKKAIPPAPESPSSEDNGEADKDSAKTSDTNQAESEDDTAEKKIAKGPADVDRVEGVTLGNRQPLAPVSSTTVQPPPPLHQERPAQNQTQPLPKTPPAPAALPPEAPPAPAQNDATSVNFEPCFKEKSDLLLAAAYKGARILNSPLQLQAFKNSVISDCAKSSTIDETTNSRLNEILIEQANTTFTESSAIIGFYKAIEAKPIPQSERLKIYKSYGAYIEIKSKDIQFSGTIENGRLMSNILTYNIKTASGLLLIESQNLQKEFKSRTISITNPVDSKLNAKLIFNFKNNTVNVESDSIQIELKFVIKNGSPLLMKVNKPMTIALTLESWNELLLSMPPSLIAENEFRELGNVTHTLSIHHADRSLTRLCTLTSNAITCRDPEHSVKATTDPSTWLTGSP